MISVFYKRLNVKQINLALTRSYVWQVALFMSWIVGICSFELTTFILYNALMSIIVFYVAGHNQLHSQKSHRQHRRTAQHLAKKIMGPEGHSL